MSGQEADQWILKTMNIHQEGTVDNRFDDSTTVRTVLDEVAFFVMGGGGFNVECGHSIESTPNCVRRCSVQIIVDLEEAAVQNLHKCNEAEYLKEDNYSTRLALENRAIEILRAHHTSSVVTITSI